MRDVWFYRIVVIGLSLSVVGSLVVIALFGLWGKSTPESAVAIGAGAVGALAGLFK